MKKHSKFAALAFAALGSLGMTLFAQPLAAADIYDDRIYVSPMATYFLSDSDRNLDDGFGASLSVGRRFADNLALEVSGLYLSADAKGSGVASNDSASLVGGAVSALFFPRNSLPNAYGIVGAGFGSGSDHPGAPSDYDGANFHAGLGYLFPLDLIRIGSALRAEAKFFMDSHRERMLGNGGRNEFYDGLFSLGLFIPIGDAPAQAEPVSKVSTVVPAALPADTDGDGVPDDLDKCPGTEAGVQVDENGCPLPKCVDAVPGQPVNMDGCADGDVIVLRGVTFEFDKSTLTQESAQVLNSVGEALNASRVIEVELSGHTDSMGSDAYNLKLSERRANAVKSYLANLGVDPARMKTLGFGESVPIADNGSEVGRALNRRVELKVLKGRALVDPIKSTTAIK